MTTTQVNFTKLVDPVDDSSSTALSDSKELHALLTNTQFAFLVIFCCCCHYAALVISALAVGESTNVLVVPFVLGKSLLFGFAKAVVKVVKRRRRTVFVGVEYEDDGSDHDNFDDINQPAEGGFK
ncbi:hypothetical protein DQ04_01701000 [Trypanosoma grayi]|uniref:hypothetical protein n=1 Tax=Trypanosoma grayi TaxID=71804 RepID=UPI0004F431C0|nr:hypothetical protein DQ04_01701000 [Trypanosoma grayi]KEG12449.1 hypothetical protein DQ04_01701000 [Trypanosoma grayi]